jgi:hypothetical protein
MVKRVLTTATMVAVLLFAFTAVAFTLALWVAADRGLLTRRTVAELGFAAGALPFVLLVIFGISRL